MQIIALLKTFIYLVASSLFLPVLILLSCLFVWMLIYSGSFFRTWLERYRTKTEPGQLPEKIVSGSYHGHLPPEVEGIVKTIETLKTSDNPVLILNLLRDAEHRMWKSLDKLKLMIRIGPGLGLIGTLIPMGTGLASLGQGDLNQLSQDLIVAFTTTVVGMALGMLAYFYYTVQRRWVEQDIKNMELAAELLSGRMQP